MSVTELKITQTRESGGWIEAGRVRCVKGFVYAVSLPEVYSVVKLSVCGMPLSTR